MERLAILANGREVYSCNYANHCVNIKNLLEYNPSYAEIVATNEFYFLDTTRNAERIDLLLELYEMLQLTDTKQHFSPL